jgi:YVTN family beta-propeller protein
VPNLDGVGYVSVIDTQTHVIVGNVIVGFAPRQAVVSPDGAHVYVTNQESDSVSVIEVSTESVVDTVTLGAGHGPSSIAVKPFEILTFSVTTVANAGEGSLRQAFLDANANRGPDFIEFSIPGPGPHTISPNSPLPALTSPVVLDATTEPDYAGTPIVEIEGSSAGAGAAGIELRGGSSIVHGFAVNRFEGVGIVLYEGGNNSIRGNYVGTDLTGSLDEGNGHGILIDNSQNNDVGGLVRNVISGNEGMGVFITGPRATGNRIRSNRIGTDVSGSSAIANNGTGVLLWGPRNTVGGPSIGDRNIISGNGIGILIDVDAGNSTILANFVGVDASGTVPLGNAGWGIEVLSDANTIGGPSSFNINVISGNGLGGVRLAGSNNGFYETFIGTDLGATLNLGNAGPGVQIDGGSDNTFGVLGTVSILHNTGEGVVILAGERNSLDGSFIHSNGGLGLDLGGDGVTANDSGGDPDSGPNTLLNYPVLTSAVTGANLTVTGTFHSVPGVQFNVDYYTTSACDPSGNGEGETPIGSSNLITGPSGDAFINFTGPAVSAGLFVTAFATDAVGNTSEFSTCVLVTP